MNNKFLLGEKSAMAEQTKSYHLYGGKGISPCAGAAAAAAIAVGKSKSSPSKFSWGGKGVQSNSNQFKQFHDNVPKKHLLRSTVQIDAKVYTDTKSKGLTSRLVKYYGDSNRINDDNCNEINNSSNSEKRLGSQIYKKVGDFPIVHLKKPHLSSPTTTTTTFNLRKSSSLSSLKVLSPQFQQQHQQQHQSRYAQLNARSQILRSGSVVSLQDEQKSPKKFNTTSPSPPQPPKGLSNYHHTTNNMNNINHHRDCNEKLYLRDNQPLQSLHTEYEAHPTPSVLDALKEISRKRINCDDLDGDQVKKAKGEIARKSSSSYYMNSQLQNQSINGSLSITTTTTTSATTTTTASTQSTPMLSKRQRDDNNISPNSNSMMLQAQKKRVCPTTTNDILSSLSSSTNLYKSKRKLDSHLLGEQTVKKSNSEVIQTSKYTNHNTESLESESNLTVISPPSSSSSTILQQLESQKLQNLTNVLPINTSSSSTSSSMLSRPSISIAETLLNGSLIQPPINNTNNHNSIQKQPTITLFNKIYHNKILTNNNKNNNNNKKDGNDDYDDDDDDDDINAGIAFIKVKKPDIMQNHQLNSSKIRIHNEKDNEKSKLTLMLSCLQKELDGNEDDDDDYDAFDGRVDVSKSQVNMIETNVLKSNPLTSITTSSIIETQQKPSNIINSMTPTTTGSITNSTASLNAAVTTATTVSKSLTFGISPKDQSIVTSSGPAAQSITPSTTTTTTAATASSSSEQRIGGFCFAATPSTPTVSYQTTSSITPTNANAQQSFNTLMNNTQTSSLSSSSPLIPIDFSQIKIPSPTSNSNTPLTATATATTTTTTPTTLNLNNAPTFSNINSPSTGIGFNSAVPNNVTTTSTSLSFPSPKMNFAFGTTATPTTTTIQSSNNLFTDVKAMARSSTTSNPSSTNDLLFKFNGNEAKSTNQQQQSPQMPFGIQTTQSPIFQSIQSNTTADSQLNVFGKSSTNANELPGSTSAFQFGGGMVGGNNGNATITTTTTQNPTSNAVVKNLFDVPNTFNAMPPTSSSSNGFPFNGNSSGTINNNKIPSSNNFIQSSSLTSPTSTGGNNNNPSSINIFGNLNNTNTNLQNPTIQTKPINVFGGGGGDATAAAAAAAAAVAAAATGGFSGGKNSNVQTLNQNKPLFFESTNTFGSPKSTGIQSSTATGANQQLFVFGGGGGGGNTNNTNTNNSLQNQQTFGSNSGGGGGVGGNVVINKPTASAAPFSFTTGALISPIATSSSSTIGSLQNQTSASSPIFGGVSSTINVSAPTNASSSSSSSNAPFIFGNVGGGGNNSNNTTTGNGNVPSFSLIANNNNNNNNSNNFNNNNTFNNNTFGSTTTSQNSNTNNNNNNNNNNGGNQMIQQNQSSNNQNSSNGIFNFTGSNSNQNQSSSSSSSQINTATVGPFTFGGGGNNNNNNTAAGGGNGDNQSGFSFNANSNGSIGNNPFTFTANNNNNNSAPPNLFNTVQATSSSPSPSTSYVRSKNYRAPTRKYR